MVDTEWLAENIDKDPTLRIYDCSVFFGPPVSGSNAPYSVRSALQEHRLGHIPGAEVLDIQEELSEPSAPEHLKFMMPKDLDYLAQQFAKRGLGKDTHPILYSRGTPMWATRVWWMLRALGFDHASVLDGGYNRWAAEGRPIEMDTNEKPSSSYPPAEPIDTNSENSRPGLFVDASHVLEALGDTEVCTINALKPKIHTGQDDKYGRPGRIPGSVNVPYSSILTTVEAKTDEDEELSYSLFADAETASRAFLSAGAKKDGENILYCGGGISATIDAFLMHQLGYENVVVYDGSLGEWAKDDTLPMETD